LSIIASPATIRQAIDNMCDPRRGCESGLMDGGRRRLTVNVKGGFGEPFERPISRP
jgi:hypothetical protein